MNSRRQTTLETRDAIDPSPPNWSKMSAKSFLFSVDKFPSTISKILSMVTRVPTGFFASFVLSFTSIC